MKFNKKLEALKKANVVTILDVNYDDEDSTVCIKNSNIDDRYSNNVECYILTIKEFINRTASTFVDCYFHELISEMEEAEKKWNVTPENSLINTLLGLDRTDYSNGGGYDKLTKRAKKYVKANLDNLIKNDCLSYNNKDYIINNKFVLFVL